MNIKTRTALALSMVVATLNIQVSTLLAQGTAFSYNGRLLELGVPANGRYDLAFSLFGASSGPPQIGNTVFLPAVEVVDGLFAASIDFGGGAFPGSERFLEISARSNNVGSFTTLTPRQKLGAVPYAITASNVTGTLPQSGLSGTYSRVVAFDNPTNSFSGNGAGLTSLNASQLITGSLADTRLSDNVALLNRPAQRFVGPLGIGASPPAASLHVNGAALIHRTLTPDSTSASNLLNLVVGGGSNPVATNGSLNGISFYESLGSKAMSLGYDGSGISSANALRIYHANDAPLFTFEASGEFGVGLSAPLTALHIVDSLDAQISIESSDAGAHRWSLQSSRVAGSANLDAAFQIVDRTLNISRFFIGTNGNVGIGINNPAASLHVSGSLQANGPIRANGGLVIENRTSDPPAPATGQIWLRTDL